MQSGCIQPSDHSMEWVSTGFWSSIHPTQPGGMPYGIDFVPRFNPRVDDEIGRWRIVRRVILIPPERHDEHGCIRHVPLKHLNRSTVEIRVELTDEQYGRLAGDMFSRDGAGHRRIPCRLRPEIRFHKFKIELIGIDIHQIDESLFVVAFKRGIRPLDEPPPFIRERGQRLPPLCPCNPNVSGAVHSPRSLDHLPRSPRR